MGFSAAVYANGGAKLGVAWPVIVQKSSTPYRDGGMMRDGVLGRVFRRQQWVEAGVPEGSVGGRHFPGKESELQGDASGLSEFR